MEVVELFDEHLVQQVGVGCDQDRCRTFKIPGGGRKEPYIIS